MVKQPTPRLEMTAWRPFVHKNTRLEWRGERSWERVVAAGEGASDMQVVWVRIRQAGQERCETLMLPDAELTDDLARAAAEILYARKEECSIRWETPIVGGKLP